MAYSTSAIHLAASHSTPKFNSRRHVSAKGFNSDDDLRAQSFELEFTKDGNASLAAAVDPLDHRPDSLSSEDLVPSRDVGTAPKENALYRSCSTMLPSTKLDPAMIRRSPASYSTLQRVKERQVDRATRASSPGSEMVTLEEFLQESGQLATSASSRDDLLSDYFKKKSEPSNISEQPNRKETIKVPTSLVAKPTCDALDGRVSRPGQHARPSPRPSGRDSPATSSSARQVVPGHGGTPSMAKVAQLQHPSAGGPRGNSLTRAFSLASADLHWPETPRRAATDGPPLGRVNGKSSWKSTGDCSGLQPELRERPQSTRGPGAAPAADICCRTLDPRRLSLAPPKDEKFLTLPPHVGTTGSLGSPLGSPGTHQTPADRRAVPRGGEVALVSPVRATSLQAEEQKGWTRGPHEDSNTSPQSRSPGCGNAPRGAEDPGKGSTGGSRSMPASPDPNSDQQTVWYEYGCV